METEIICPLGSKCEDAKEGKLVRCAWYTKLVGKNPQTDKDVDEWACAMAWMPLMMVENAQTNRGQTQALNSFRNEMVKGNDIIAKVLVATNKDKLIEVSSDQN